VRSLSRLPRAFGQSTRLLSSPTSTSRSFSSLSPLHSSASSSSSSWESSWSLRFGLLLGLAGATVYYQRETRGNIVLADEKDEFMSDLQPTVVSGMHPQGAFVTIRLTPQANLKEVAKAVATLPQVVEELSPGPTKKGYLPSLMAGVGFAPHIWTKFSRRDLPKHLTAYKERSGPLGDMPATGGDILLHVKGDSHSICFETVLNFVNSFPPGSIEKVEDWYGFEFQQGRDLSGFIDGTENPAEFLHRVQSAVIDGNDPKHAFGSYAVHQRWVHDLKPFHAIPVAQQEKVVGRSKPDSAELQGEENPPSSHVSRMRVDGKKVDIVRQSMPYGTVGGEHGLLFLAYANTPAKFDILLDRMVGADKTHTDAVMSFTKCVASQYYYIPSRKELYSLNNL